MTVRIAWRPGQSATRPCGPAPGGSAVSRPGRSWYARRVAKVGDDDLDAMLARLEDDDAMVAGLAAESVAQIRPTDPRLVNALVRYARVATNHLGLVSALARTLKAQPNAAPVRDALCQRIREPVPQRGFALMVAEAVADDVEVARALLACALDSDGWAATEAVRLLRKGSPAILPEARDALARATTVAERARLLAVLSVLGETSHVDLIRDLLRSDDDAAWGEGTGLDEVTGLSRTFETPARYVGGLLAIAALRARKGELVAELRFIVEECGDPTVAREAAEELVAIGSDAQSRPDEEHEQESPECGEERALSLSRRSTPCLVTLELLLRIHPAS